MAAAIISGVNGSITFAGEGGQVGQITEWTAVVNRIVFDVTAFGDTDNWRVKQGGMASLTGSATGFFDQASATKIAGFATEDDAADGAMTLTATSGKYYTFLAIVKDVTVNTTRTGGPVSISFNFESSDEVQEDTAL